MVRLLFICIVIIFGASVSDFCDWKYPIVNDYYNELWDKLKHQLYLVFAGLCALIATLYHGKNKWAQYVTDGLLSMLITGVIPQMIIEKNQNRFEPHEYKDYAWLLISCIPGLIYNYYVRRASSPIK